VTLTVASASGKRAEYFHNVPELKAKNILQEIHKYSRGKHFMAQNFKFKTRKFKAQHPCRKARINRASQGTPTKRHTHNTIAGLEDLTAVLLDVSFALKRLDNFILAIHMEIENAKSRVDTALDTVNVIRISPHAYPVDRPKRNANATKKTTN
jgi:hypothetical protein